jgi:hypothetical protein
VFELPAMSIIRKERHVEVIEFIDPSQKCKKKPKEIDKEAAPSAVKTLTPKETRQLYVHNDNSQLLHHIKHSCNSMCC